MDIQCPECGKTGKILDETVGDEGRNLTCPQCRNRFLVTPPPAQENGDVKGIGEPIVVIRETNFSKIILACVITALVIGTGVFYLAKPATIAITPEKGSSPQPSASGDSGQPSGPGTDRPQGSTPPSDQAGRNDNPGEPSTDRQAPPAPQAAWPETQTNTRPSEYQQPQRHTPENLKNAVLALKKLEARCQTGISYREYIPYLGEIRYSVNAFLESAESARYPSVSRPVADSFSHFEFAARIWEVKVSERKSHIDRFHPLAPRILQYPGADNSIDNGGVTIEINKISVEHSLKMAWRKAFQGADEAYDNFLGMRAGGSQ